MKIWLQFSLKALQENMHAHYRGKEGPSLSWASGLDMANVSSVYLVRLKSVQYVLEHCDVNPTMYSYHVPRYPSIHSVRPEHCSRSYTRISHPFFPLGLNFLYAKTWVVVSGNIDAILLAFRIAYDIPALELTC